MVNNQSLKGVHKEAVAFFLKKINESIDEIREKIPVTPKDLIQQINSATIEVESTPYYCIMKFNYDGVYEVYHNKTIEIQVVRENIPPIVFHMYLKNGKLYEFEYFKADSSKIHNEELFLGAVVIGVY